MNLVREWLDWLERVRHTRGATLDAYGRTLFKFEEWASVNNWDAVTPEQIEAFMGRPRRDGNPAAPSSQERDRQCIKQFYKWALARGHVSHDPTFDVGVPKINNRMPRAIDDHIWERLWLSELTDDDRAWLGLGFFCGLRRRELVNLRPSQIDPSRRMLMSLERKGGKEDVVEYFVMAKIIGDNLPHLCPDPEGWATLLEQRAKARLGERCLITMDRPATEGERFAASFTDPDLPSPAVINHQLNKLLRKAKIPPDDWFTPHALRHSCVTNLLRSGVPIDVVSDVVGHNNIDTTRRYIKSAGRLTDWQSRLLRARSALSKVNPTTGS